MAQSAFPVAPDYKGSFAYLGAQPYTAPPIVSDTSLTAPSTLFGAAPVPPASPSITAPQAGVTSSPAKASTLNPTAAAAYGGLQAGQAGTQAYDTKSGVVSALGAGAAGATAGAIVGGPVGAAAGGASGLILGGLNAWLSVGAKNKARREEKRLLQEAEAKQKKRDTMLRDDALSEQAYQRGETSRQQQWAKNLQIQNNIKELIANGTLSRDRFVKTGRI